jgi:hypothetical protein
VAYGCISAMGVVVKGFLHSPQEIDNKSASSPNSVLICCYEKCVNFQGALCFDVDMQRVGANRLAYQAFQDVRR